MFRHFAYLDPGTGSMVIQAAIGVVAGVGIFARRAIGSVIGKATSALAARKHKTSTENNE